MIKFRTTIILTVLSWSIIIKTVSSSFRKENDNDKRKSQWNSNLSPNLTYVSLLHRRLSNGVDIPLLGTGVGNLAHDILPGVLVQAHEISSNSNSHLLIDTARASQNEKTVAKVLSKADGKLSGKKKRLGGKIHQPIINVVTKVWYTHLGYQRTKLSVIESLTDLVPDEALSDTCIHVHVLLHWPKCDDNIPWMNCAAEEEALPHYVKEAGPPPHLRKGTAWKESWKALEDMYEEHSKYKGPIKVKLVSIGVSNFNQQEMEELLQIARIKPHIYQGNIWSLIFDPNLMMLLNQNNIMFQVYNAVNGILSQADRAPNAFQQLLEIATTHFSIKTSTNRQEEAMAVIKVVLAWLVSNSISVIPRSSSEEHLIANSPASLLHITKGMIDLTKQQLDVSTLIERPMSALLRGEDLEPKVTKAGVHARFFNHHSVPITLFWVSHDKELKEAGIVKPGESHVVMTFPGHTFIASHKETAIEQKYTITAQHGEAEKFHMEL